MTNVIVVVSLRLSEVGQVNVEVARAHYRGVIPDDAMDSVEDCVPCLGWAFRPQVNINNGVPLPCAISMYRVDSMPGNQFTAEVVNKGVARRLESGNSAEPTWGVIARRSSGGTGCVVCSG